jgi:hypothetical protein
LLPAGAKPPGGIRTRRKSATFSWRTSNPGETIPRDSQHCLNLQFTDMVAGVVQSYFEFGQTRYWDVLSAHIRLETLFFEST